MVPFLVKTSEYYIGFISAMNYWGMTEQLPIVVHVALKSQKRRLEAVQTEFVFVKKKSLGDFVQVQFDETSVNISSIEQTILDGLSFPEYCLGIGEVAKAIHYSTKRIDWSKLMRLANEEKGVVRRRLGFLLELLGLKKQAKELSSKFTGFMWLDPGAQKEEFEYNKKWGLKVNKSKNDLLEFLEGY
ncbi:MAG: type IV toxin-antitoxin system AbiEi family antitoxin [Candidatus Micrarchaeota archaeon]